MCPRPSIIILGAVERSARAFLFVDGSKAWAAGRAGERQSADAAAARAAAAHQEATRVGIYSAHPNDNNGFTWQGNAALMSQADALRAANGVMGREGAGRRMGDRVDR